MASSVGHPATPPAGLLETGRRRDPRLGPEMHKVDLRDLLQFVFPGNLQHAMSTGRLFAFGYNGPLDANAQLRSGFMGQHPLQQYELDTMCRQFEREDLLQIFMHKGQNPSTLSEEQAEELIAQADTRLKVAKGKALMKQVTPLEVEQLFEDLPRDEDGLMSFHDMQRRIIDYRAAKVEQNKVVYPDLTSKPRHKLGALPASVPAFQPIGPLGTKRSTIPRGVRVGATVAPASMFQRNRGKTNMELSSHTNRLLNTKAPLICNIADGNSPSLSANVRLIRDNTRSSDDLRPAWDQNCMTKGRNMGAFVQSAASRTTHKRLA